MTIKGEIEHIGTEETSGTFKKRSLILKTERDSQYPQSINIEFQQDRVDLIDPYNVGQEVTVSYNLKGRKWTDPQGVDKYFNTIVGWKIEGNTNF